MTAAATVHCVCGQPLHYHDAIVQELVERMVARHGPTIAVTVLYKDRLRTWLVPRHFIALHGLVAQRLPELARRYAFAEEAR